MIAPVFSPIKALLGRFKRSEDGSATVEFAITFPSMLILMLSGIELGMVTLHHSMLERAMDITVREIRLSTGTPPEHEVIKAKICARAGFVGDCNANMRLEMIQINPFAWSGIEAVADCTDQSEDVTPVREFKNDAEENDLMILRACAKFDPVFPTSGFGKNMVKDGAGQYALISMSVFVQEPR